MRTFLQIVDPTEIYTRRFQQWCTKEFCSGGGFNKFSSGQREQGSGGGSSLVRGSGGSCNLVQEISSHIIKIFLIFWYFKAIYDDKQFICHC